MHQYNTLFADLIRGKQAGKRVDLWVDHADTGALINPPEVALLEGRCADDSAAQQVQVSVLPPKIIRGATKEQALNQQASGGVDVCQAGDFSATPIIARIQWGTGGVGTMKGDEVEVDVANGACVNLTCSFVRVTVAPDPLLGLLGVSAGDTAAYEVQGFLSPGYPRPNNAQRTIRFRGVNAPDVNFFGTTPVVPIPRMATRCRLEVSPGDLVDPVTVQGWTAQVLFLSNDGAGVGAGLYVSNPNPALLVGVEAAVLCADNGNANGAGFSIPNNAYYCLVYHRNAFGIVPRLVFDLGI